MIENELLQVIEEGEGYKIEFKESLANLDKELVAFANSSGGRIFVGITDKKEVKGVRITNKFKSQVQDIANNCQPASKFQGNFSVKFSVNFSIKEKSKGNIMECLLSVKPKCAIEILSPSSNLRNIYQKGQGY